MMGPNPFQMAQQLMQQNPQMQQQIQQNQLSRTCMDILQTGDSQRGEQMARNFCQTMGIEPEQAVAQIKRDFAQRFGFR